MNNEPYLKLDKLTRKQFEYFPEPQQLANTQNLAILFRCFWRPIASNKKDLSLWAYLLDDMALDTSLHQKAIFFQDFF